MAIRWINVHVMWMQLPGLVTEKHSLFPSGLPPSPHHHSAEASYWPAVCLSWPVSGLQRGWAKQSKSTFNISHEHPQITLHACTNVFISTQTQSKQNTPFSCSLLFCLNSSKSITEALDLCRTAFSRHIFLHSALLFIKIKNKKIIENYKLFITWLKKKLTETTSEFDQSVYFGTVQSKRHVGKARQIAAPGNDV